MRTPSTAGFGFDSTIIMLVTSGLILVCTPVRAQFASGVSVVEVYASATDSRGEPVVGLTQQDFEIYEDGVAQAVSVFAAADFPLSVALALDRSFSMSGTRLAVARSAARVFLGELRASDEAAILAVGSEVDTAAPLSTDRQAQYAALARLDAFGTTGLHDAVVRAIELTQTAKGRRALVLLSDGVDRYSRMTAAQALESARRADVMVYPVALGPSLPPFFQQLAALSGGRAFHMGDARQLGDILRRVARELRYQYLLGYAPVPGASSDQGWRRIMVAVRRPGVTVRAREGYMARP